MKELGHEEIKQRILALLEGFAAFCDEHDLRYYLAFGTVLGAVRHQGLIPWDDDIDVCMPYPDYLRFQQLCEQEKPWFRTMHYGNTEGFLNYFTKIVDPATRLESFYMDDVDGMGLFIDIFPLTEVHLVKSEKKVRRDMSIAIEMLYLSEMKTCWPSDSFVKNCVKKTLFRAAKVFGKDHWQKSIEKIRRNASEIHETEKSQYLFSSVVLDESMFAEGTKLPFEGKMFVCPKDYKAYLTALYGDYMQLPPEDKRVSNHDFKAYSID